MGCPYFRNKISPASLLPSLLCLCHSSIKLISSMRKLMDFIKISIAAGVLFLIPVMVIGLVLAKVIGFLYNLSKPITAQLPFENVGGVGVNTLMSIILLLLACFLAGLFMRTNLARKMTQWLED